MISEQFQDFLAGIGVDLTSILEAAGVNKVIWQEQLDLTDAEYWQLMTALDQTVDDQALISFGDIAHINTFMPSFFAALSAHDGWQAVHRLATYKSLVGPVSLTITSVDDTVRLQIHGNHLATALPRFTVMTEQLLLVSLLRTGTGQALAPISVAGPYPYGAIAPVLGVEPQQRTDNVIVFRRSDLERPFISANNTMWTFMRPELDRQKLAIESTKTLSDNVQAILLKQIPSGTSSIEEVASRLNLSKRTLQRGLSGLGTTFNQEVQRARKLLAIPLMQDATLSLIEVSYLLGYADPESFSRAFKTWFDQSPSAYRSHLAPAN